MVGTCSGIAAAVGAGSPFVAAAAAVVVDVGSLAAVGTKAAAGMAMAASVHEWTFETKKVPYRKTQMGHFHCCHRCHRCCPCRC